MEVEVPQPEHAEPVAPEPEEDGAGREDAEPVAAPNPEPAAAPKPAPAAPKRGLKRPASAKAHGQEMIVAPSGKRCTARVVDQQDKLGCNKCVYRALGCSRCKEIHELWKARQS